jgi:hypothetical protein
MNDFITKYGRVVYLVAGIFVLWVVWALSGSIISRRYEKRLEEATKTAEAKAQAAQVKTSEANAARDQAEGLKIDLAAREKEISDLNLELAAAKSQTGKTRIKYVETKTNPMPSVVLSDDLAADRRLVCSGLREVGITCK